MIVVTGMQKFINEQKKRIEYYLEKREYFIKWRIKKISAIKKTQLERHCSYRSVEKAFSMPLCFSFDWKKSLAFVSWESNLTK